MERQAKDGTFYKKVGDDEWEPVTRQAKDGTVYAKVGKDEWTPQTSTAKPKEESTPQESDEILGIPKTTIEGALNALPFAGALAGGAVGGGTTLGVGTVVGAGVGAAGGEALANAIRAGLDLKSAPQTREEMIARPIKEGMIGAAGEGVGQIIGKVPGLVRGLKGVPVEKGTAIIPDEVIAAQKVKDLSLERTMKPNADEIVEATKRLGGKATPGMTSSNQNIQNIENVLSQSPTIAGERVRSSYQPIRKGLQDSAENLAGTPNLSPFEAGEQFKAGLKTKVAEKVEPLSSQFEKIRESSRFIKPDKVSLDRSADRLLKQDLAEFKDLPQGQAIQKYAGMIREAKSLDSLKQLRTSVGDEIGQAIDKGDGQTAMALGKVKSSIQRLERREILKSAIESMPTKKQGEAAAKDLIGEIKSVNKGWRALMGEIEVIGKAGGINNVSSPSHLVRIIDDMPSEKIADRFFNTKNYAGLRDVKTHLPEEFEVLRQNKLGQIAEKSLTKGEPDPVKLVRNLKAIGPESREILFGKSGEQVLKDMETVLNSMPSKVGSSDTPRGASWFAKVLKPNSWSEEAQGAYSYMQLQGLPQKGLKNQTVRDVIETTKNQIPRSAGYGLVQYKSNEERRGRDKWAASGLEKLSSIDSGKFSMDKLDQFIRDPKKKELLIKASDLRPGTKAMDRIIEDLNKLSEGAE